MRKDSPILARNTGWILPNSYKGLQYKKLYMPTKILYNTNYTKSRDRSHSMHAIEKVIETKLFSKAVPTYGPNKSE